MDPKVKCLVDQVKAHLRERYGDGIKRVILYGSHARSEATQDSDVDVLGLVDRSLDPREVEDSLDNLLYDIIVDEGELVSVMAISEERFENYNSPFMLNVREEGITA
ncbi:MAG: nucleotidyltransferase domain-containing protein [Planctomycetes bacterium]|jgi:predicted nucleotidyltransferase|nr:nucleotidyltransferase domain-containing protein [Planctomycetota bacterium]